MTAARVGYVLGTTQGGTWRHVAMLAAGCARAGLDVRVFGPAQARVRFGSSEPIEFDPVTITDRPRPARDAIAVRRLRRLLTTMAPDVVHAHGMRAGALAALALRRGPRPVLVVTVHNAPPPARPAAAIYGILERLVSLRADAVLCVSADLSARMRRLGAKDVGHAVVPAPWPAPAPVGQVPAELAADGSPVVLAVGRLAPQKGFDTLIAAAARWRDRSPAPLVVIAGTGPLADDLAAQARDLAVAARFLGSRDDVAALLAAADVFVLPSRWEGQPLILQEALRAGRPIVAADVGGVRELTGDDAALLVRAGDPAGLAAAVLRVLDDAELAVTLGTAAAARAARLPTPADATDAVLALYDRLTARK